MADNVMCDRCGSTNGIKEYVIDDAWTEKLCSICSGEEQNAEVTGGEPTDTEISLFEILSGIQDKYQDIDTEQLTKMVDAITARLTALQSAHEKELADYKRKVLEKLPKEQSFEEATCLEEENYIDIRNRLIAETKTAIEAIDTEAEMKCPKCGSEIAALTGHSRDICCVNCFEYPTPLNLFNRVKDLENQLIEYGFRINSSNERAEKAEAELEELKASVRQAQIDLLDRVSKKIWAGDPCPDRYEIQEILTAEKEA